MVRCSPNHFGEHCRNEKKFVNGVACAQPVLSLRRKMERERAAR